MSIRALTFFISVMNNPTKLGGSTEPPIFFYFLANPREISRFRDIHNGLDEISKKVYNIVENLITQEILSKNQLWSLVPALISAIFIIVDKMVLKESIIEKFSNWYTERCKAKYAAKVKESLNERSKHYSEEIVEYCIAKSAFFNE